MTPLLWLVAAGSVYSLLMFLGWLLAALRVRPALEGVELFSGPVLWAGQVAGVPVTVGWIPFGAALRLPDLEDPAEADGAAYEHLPAGSQALLELLPVLVVLSAAAVVLREATLPLVVSGIPEILAGGLSPRVEGVRLVQAWIGFLDFHGPVLAVAVLLTKLVALNLLPLPGSAAGRLVLARLGRKGAGLVTLVGAGVGLALSAGWLFAILLALRGG